MDNPQPCNVCVGSGTTYQTEPSDFGARHPTRARLEECKRCGGHGVDRMSTTPGGTWRALDEALNRASLYETFAAGVSGRLRLIAARVLPDAIAGEIRDEILDTAESLLGMSKAIDKITEDDNGEKNEEGS